jgi:hypothetical protein
MMGSEVQSRGWKAVLFSHGKSPSIITRPDLLLPDQFPAIATFDAEDIFVSLKSPIFLLVLGRD